MDKMKKSMAICLFLAAFGCGGGDDDDGQGTPDSGGGGAADAGSSGPDGAVGACSVTPGTWAAPSFATGAADALALRAQLDELGTLMRGAEQETMTVDDIADLTALFEAGDPSLGGVVTAGYAPVVEDVFADFVALALAGVQDLVDDENQWTPGESGGLFGDDTRGLNTGGLEVRQLVDKGVFAGAGMYAYALGLTEGPIGESTIDALAGAWGSNETLATDEPTDSANYSFAMGFHAEIAEALTRARAFAADDACAAERDAALVTFFRAWEQSMVARTVYYGNLAAGLVAAAATDTERANALHELSEGIGLTLGFHGLQDPASGPLAGAGRVLTDADVEAIAAALGVDLADLGASTTGEFLEDPAALQIGVESVEATVIEVFDLTPADILTYRAPTEG